MQKKIVKSYTLSEETINAIETYASVSGNSLSQTTENLIHNGLENIERTENIKDEIRIELKRLIETDRKNADRLANLMIKQTRILGKIFGTTLTHAVRTNLINEDEIDAVLKSGINKAMQDLKSDERKAYE